MCAPHDRGRMKPASAPEAEARWRGAQDALDFDRDSRDTSANWDATFLRVLLQSALSAGLPGQGQGRTPFEPAKIAGTQYVLPSIS
jgi:hypothetical protein